jgi:hypothetical protein
VHNVFGNLDRRTPKMDMLAYCRAMAAFCRQRAKFEDENDTFWISEAEEWDKLIFEYESPHIRNLIGQTARGGIAAASPTPRPQGGF